MTTAAKVTAEQLLHLTDDGFRYELVRGELIKMAPAGSEHGELAMRIGWRLAQYTEIHKLGKVYAAETGFHLASNPDTVRAPDVAFVSQQRAEEAGAVRGYWPGPPDLAIEVISPTDNERNIAIKIANYLAAGTVVWVMRPDVIEVEVYTPNQPVKVLTAADTLDGGDVLPGFTLTVKDIFPEK